MLILFQILIIHLVINLQNHLETVHQTHQYKRHHHPKNRNNFILIQSEKMWIYSPQLRELKAASLEKIMKDFTHIQMLLKNRKRKCFEHLIGIKLRRITAI
jgi:hypothetical protein